MALPGSNAEAEAEPLSLAIASFVETNRQILSSNCHLVDNLGTHVVSLNSMVGCSHEMSREVLVSSSGLAVVDSPPGF